MDAFQRPGVQDWNGNPPNGQGDSCQREWSCLGGKVRGFLSPFATPLLWGTSFDSCIYPELDQLPPDCQAALVSLVDNRGNSLAERSFNTRAHACHSNGAQGGQFGENFRASSRTCRSFGAMD